MKYLLPILILGIALFGLTSDVRAEVVSGETEFYYVLHLQWDGDVLTEASRYNLTTADMFPPVWGDWRIAVVGVDGTVRSSAKFNPRASGAAFDVTLAKPGDGTAVVVTNERGVEALRIDTRDSRVCDGNGVCDGERGESSENCPGDCGAPLAERPAQQQTAAITDTLSERAGGVMVRIAYAGVAALLLFAIAATLDIRRRV